MDYKQLGSSGLRVSEMCLGAMTFGRADWGATPEESRRVFEAYGEAGGNFVDTANNYADGRSEEIVGELLNDDRARVGLANNATGPIRSRDVNAFGNHRKSLVGSLDQSLRRLRTDYIDLLWVHVWDGVTPVEEMMRALDDQVRAGKVLYLGISDAPAWAVAEANALARVRGWTPFSAIQIEYSLVERTVERELIPLAARRGLSVLAWGPLGAGRLADRQVRRHRGGGRARGGPPSGRRPPAHPAQPRDRRRGARCCRAAAVSAGPGRSCLAALPRTVRDPDRWCPYSGTAALQPRIPRCRAQRRAAPIAGERERGLNGLPRRDARPVRDPALTRLPARGDWRREVPRRQRAGSAAIDAVSASGSSRNRPGCSGWGAPRL